MNKVVLMGRLTREPEVRYSQGAEPMAIARYTLAVDRKYRREGEDNADFVSCMCFGKAAEFAEKYFDKINRFVMCITLLAIYLGVVYIPEILQISLTARWVISSTIQTLKDWEPEAEW